jgi:hypothetical protein
MKFSVHLILGFLVSYSSLFALNIGKSTDTLNILILNATQKGEACQTLIQKYNKPTSHIECEEKLLENEESVDLLAYYKWTLLNTSTNTDFEDLKLRDNLLKIEMSTQKWDLLYLENNAIKAHLGIPKKQALDILICQDEFEKCIQKWTSDLTSDSLKFSQNTKKNSILSETMDDFYREIKHPLITPYLSFGIQSLLFLSKYDDKIGVVNEAGNNFRSLDIGQEGEDSDILNLNSWLEHAPSYHLELGVNWYNFLHTAIHGSYSTQDVRVKAEVPFDWTYQKSQIGILILIKQPSPYIKYFPLKPFAGLETSIIYFDESFELNTNNNQAEPVRFKLPSSLRSISFIAGLTIEGKNLGIKILNNFNLDYSLLYNNISQPTEDTRAATIIEPGASTTDIFQKISLRWDY